MALISDWLAADLSADASADALCIINIGNSSGDTSEVINKSKDEERSCKHSSQHIQPTIAL